MAVKRTILNSDSLQGSALTVERILGALKAIIVNSEIRELKREVKRLQDFS